MLKNTLQDIYINNMEIIVDFPPNYSIILAKFPSIANRPVVFSYGNKLYNPTNASIPEHLMVHEKTHSRQQAQFPSVEKWWEDYLTEPNFRLIQEVEAYQEQYRFFSASTTRELRKSFLHKIAKDLSSPMYGNLCSYEYAKKLISQTV